MGFCNFFLGNDNNHIEKEKLWIKIEYISINVL
jgi:hypothetical protein